MVAFSITAASMIGTWISDVPALLPPHTIFPQPWTRPWPTSTSPPPPPPRSAVSSPAFHEDLSEGSSFVCCPDGDALIRPCRARRGPQAAVSGLIRFIPSNFHSRYCPHRFSVLLALSPPRRGRALSVTHLRRHRKIRAPNRFHDRTPDHAAVVARARRIQICR